MKVAIIGSRRRRSGIGRYIARYFHQNGATVTAVLGTTAESAAVAAAELSQDGIHTTPYADFSAMAGDSGFDTVAIASPTATHYSYLVQSLHAGAHVFCEKPFIFTEKNDMDKNINDIFMHAGAGNLTVGMNSQWPFSLRFYEELCGPIDPAKVDRFFIRLSPLCSGKEMIIEAVPHALSILHCTCGSGTLSNLGFQHHDDEHLIIDALYHSPHATLSVVIELIRNELPPRELVFGFNDLLVRRTVNLDRYEIFFTHAGRTLKIVDPLHASVGDFIAAVKDHREPFIGKTHIISTTLLLKQLYTSCTLN